MRNILKALILYPLHWLFALLATPGVIVTEIILRPMFPSEYDSLHPSRWYQRIARELRYQFVDRVDYWFEE